MIWLSRKTLMSLAALLAFAGMTACGDEKDSIVEKSRVVVPIQEPVKPDPGTKPEPQPECQSGDAAVCTGTDTLKYCDEGRWTTKQCDFGCEADRCKAPDCDENSTPRCTDGLTREFCENHAWKSERCTDDEICDAGGCVPGPECDASFGTACESDSERRYCEDGHIRVKLCESHNVCRYGECVPECDDTFVPECTDKKTLKACDHGAFVETTCEHRCVPETGECGAPLCIANRYINRCVDEKTINTCVDEEPTDVECEWKCENNTCVEPFCRENTHVPECLTTTIRRYCSNFELETESCSYRCEYGECIEPPCTLGAVRCGSNANEDVLYRCEQDEETGLISYRWYKNCKNSDLTCDPKYNSCEICRVDDWGCSTDEVLQMCTRSGGKNVWTDKRDCAERNKVCSASTRGCKFCKLGDVSCDGETLQMCGGDSWIEISDCSKSDLFCSDSLDACLDACTDGDVLCYENNLAHCVDGRWVLEQKCGNDTCSEDLDACSCPAGTFKCLGSLLLSCATGVGWDEVADCGDNTCDAQQGVCRHECEETDPVVCDSITARRICVDYRYRAEACGEHEMCRNGACVDDPSSYCSENEVWDGEKCSDRPPESVIGVPCACSGDDCSTIITGADFNYVLKSLAKMAIGEMDVAAMISAPDFFAKNITGCENVVPPDGMKVGCMRTSTFVATKGVTDYLEKINEKLIMLERYELAQVLKNIINVMSANTAISFISPEGYCFTAAMDANVSLSETSGVINGALYVNDFKAMIDRFDAGDYNQAKLAECPLGSVLIPDIRKIAYLAAYGNITLDMAMCLKQCLTNDDCRTDDGYSCVDWHNKKVCFMQSNISSIHQLEAGIGLRDR